MKATNSGRFQFDLKNIYHISAAACVGLVSIYISNTEVFNAIIAQHVSPQTFSVITTVLVYAAKKFATDYSKTPKK